MKTNIEEFGLIVSNVLKKFDGRENIQSVINQLTEELNDLLNHNMSMNFVSKHDFPIEFESELGHWKIDSNGDVFLNIKYGIERIITCDITINNELI